MRPLNPNEQKLIAVASLALVIVANGLLLSFLFKKQKGSHIALAQAQAEQKDAQLWLKEKELWQTRQQWLDKNQPIAAAQEDTKLLTQIVSSAREKNLEIQEQQLIGITPTAYYKEATVRLKVVGTLQNLVDWLVKLQQPTNFQAISSFNLRSDSDTTKVRCELQLSRRYAP
ncbi:MAG: hypothetical protein K1X66_07985 [Verrucomicrobiae bacterium]|nr:hypothetical protein [Verrucomicrobiae bacterium]